MRLSKLMLGMAVAAVSFAACNKEDITPSVEQGNKSIALSIANVAQTKAPGVQVAEGTAVQLNSFQVFFADAAGALYTPKNVHADAAAETYFTAQENDKLYEFHFLPKAVTEVIVVGNMPKQTVTTKDALLKAVENLTVGAEQTVGALRLFGIDTQLSAGTVNHPATDNDAIMHPDPYVYAEVNLVPTVARFEVTGFEYAQVSKTTGEGEDAVTTLLDRDYTEMVVNSLSMRNWFTTATADFAGVVKPGAEKDAFAGVELNTDNIYGKYFTKVVKEGWYYDATAYTLNAANNYVAAVNVVTGEGEAAVTNNSYAYHVFPGAVPQFLIELTGKENGVSSPLYLMTSALKVNGAALTSIEAGKVYRMAMKFDDSSLQEPEKCIQVKITVDDWNIIAVTPAF